MEFSTDIVLHTTIRAFVVNFVLYFIDTSMIVGAPVLDSELRRPDAGYRV